MTTHEPRHPECLDSERLAIFAEGGLTVEERQQIEAHLADCEDCYEALVETVSVLEQLAPPAGVEERRIPAPARRPSVVWLGGTLAAAAAVILTVNIWAGRPDALEQAMASLAQEGRAARIGMGRLSVEQTWAPALLVLRSGEAASDSLELRSAAESLKVMAATDGSRRGLHASGLAHLASRDYDRAIDALDRALAQPGTDDAVVRSDLAAALLERHRSAGSASDATRALAETDRALSASPQYLPAAFNRALALDALGDASARQAWQSYIDLDRNPAAGWLAEATQRRDGRR